MNSLILTGIPKVLLTARLSPRSVRVIPIPLSLSCTTNPSISERRSDEDLFKGIPLNTNQNHPNKSPRSAGSAQKNGTVKGAQRFCGSNRVAPPMSSPAPSKPSTASKPILNVRKATPMKQESAKDSDQSQPLLLTPKARLGTRKKTSTQSESSKQTTPDHSKEPAMPLIAKKPAIASNPRKKTQTASDPKRTVVPAESKKAPLPSDSKTKPIAMLTPKKKKPVPASTPKKEAAENTSPSAPDLKTTPSVMNAGAKEWKPTAAAKHTLAPRLMPRGLLKPAVRKGKQNLS